MQCASSRPVPLPTLSPVSFHVQHGILYPTDKTNISNYDLQWSVAVRFNGHFPGGSGLAGTGMSPLLILLELRTMEAVSGDNWSYKTCKAKCQMSPPTNQHPVFLFQDGCPSCRLTNSDKALKGNYVSLFVCLGFIGTFSTNRLYRAITVG